MTKNRFFTDKGKWLDQNDKAYLSRQMTTDFANRIPIEILRAKTLASKFSRLYYTSKKRNHKPFRYEVTLCYLIM